MAVRKGTGRLTSPPCREGLEILKPEFPNLLGSFFGGLADGTPSWREASGGSPNFWKLPHGALLSALEARRGLYATTFPEHPTHFLPCVCREARNGLSGRAV